MKISNLSKNGCFDIRIKTRGVSFVICKAKDFCRRRGVDLPKRRNPFLNKYIVFIYI
jgi:hypothetical protein